MSNRIFKLAISLFTMTAMLFSASLSSLVPSTTGAGKNAKAGAAGQLKIPILPKISITVTIGRAKKKCGGFGVCKITLGLVAAQAGLRTVKGELIRTDDGNLQLTLLEKAPEEGQTLFIDEDIPLSPTIARKLHVKKATIRRGEYAFSTNKSLLNVRLTR
jgi:hypothetical protein